MMMDSVQQSGQHGETEALELEYLEPSRLPRPLTHELVLHTASVFKPLKPLNVSLLRWNLLWLLMVLGLILMPVYLVIIADMETAYAVICTVLGLVLCVWLFAISGSLLTMYRVYQGIHTEFQARYPSSWEHYHVIVLPIYKDDMAVVERTVETLASQTEASRIVLNIAWESRTPDIEQRTERLLRAFGSRLHFHFTVHPFGLPHEIASKAANANYGLRYTVRWLFLDKPHLQSDNVIVTTCDSDTLFHPRYLESLSAAYYHSLQQLEPTTHASIWQAPLLYNWSLDKASVFVRNTALLRTTMTAGLLIPLNINPMSCFSFSLECAIRGGYWHPQIHMDDVGFLMTIMCGSQSSIRIRLLPVPVISGPTSGATWMSDVFEWYAQVRRWAIGTADNFHFFITHVANLPKLAALRFLLGYYAYYGVILCGASLFSLLASLLPFLPSDNWDWNQQSSLVPLSRSSLLLSLTVCPYLMYLAVFVLDRLWTRLILDMDEPISLRRNALHLLLVGPVLVCLSIVQLWGYVTLSWRGKAACTHHLAGKAALGSEFISQRALIPAMTQPLMTDSTPQMPV